MMERRIDDGRGQVKAPRAEALWVAEAVAEVGEWGPRGRGSSALQ